ncbi:MAG TPA: aldose epimerase, partial [Arthrobacter sp.]|nr:aldose epimerase [Arthrobacter sp.]
MSPMGEHYEIMATLGGRRQKAVITEIAASLRALEIDGVALLQDYPAQSGPPSCAGWVLVPWPNRVADGKWTYDGVPQQLEITEPGNGNALHGLLSGAAYTVAHRTSDSITLAADVTGEPGYPFELATAVRYQLTEDGLLVTHSVTNTGSRDAPVALGAHPFLRLGTFPTEELTLVINASTHLEVDD